MVCVCCLGDRLLGSKADITRINPNGDGVQSVGDLIAIAQWHSIRSELLKNGGLREGNFYGLCLLFRQSAVAW